MLLNWKYLNKVCTCLSTMCKLCELELFRHKFYLTDFGRKADRGGSNIDERPLLCFNTSS